MLIPKDPKLEELKATILAKTHQIGSAGLDGNERRDLYNETQDLRKQILARERKLYFSLEFPDELELDGLSQDELRALRGQLQMLQRALKETEDLKEAEQNKLDDRARELWRQETMVGWKIDDLRRAAYMPGPGEAPAFEPSDYSSTPGFVKSQPANNEFYVEQFRDDPWYPIIRQTHDLLEGLIPGYNISQIKEKFGGLRYYIDYPEVIPVKLNWPAFATEELVRRHADSIIQKAEAWVDGFEYARKHAHQLKPSATEEKE